MEDAETGEQLYVDTHDKAFRRTFSGGGRAARDDASDRVQAIRRRRRVAVDRRGPGRGDRPDGGAPPAAAARSHVVHLAADARARAADPARRARLPRRGAPAAAAARPRYRLLGDDRRAVVGAAASAPRAGCRAPLMLVGLAVLVIAMARPQGVISVPRVEGTVILAFDVSGSMAATDLPPTRMEAAKAAARAFVEQPAADASGSGSSPSATAGCPSRSRPTIRRRSRRRSTGSARSAARRSPAASQSALGVIAAADADPAAGYYTNRSPGPTVAPTPVPAGSHADAVRHPAERRREHDLARPAGRGQGRGRSRHPHLHRRHRQRRRGDDRRRGLQDPQPARRGPAASDRHHHRRHVLRGRAIRTSCRRSTTPSRRASSSDPKRWRSPRSSPAPGC